MAAHSVRGALAALALILVSACGSTPDGPTSSYTPSTPYTQPTIGSIQIDVPPMTPGSVIPIYKNGIQWFVERDSDRFPVPITFTMERDVDWAQLGVYLYTTPNGTGYPGYCGQNIADPRSWSQLKNGQTIAVTITGWQFGQPACDAMSIHAWLHTRNNGVLLPPSASEIVAEGVRAVSYSFRAP